jgi:hypothetical protein
MTGCPTVAALGSAPAVICQGYRMRWIDKLSMAQRVVAVIALGVALGAIARYLTSLGMRFGWYAYLGGPELSGQRIQ